MAYYCHQCNRRVTVNVALECENCHGEFVEEIENPAEFLDSSTTSNNEVEEIVTDRDDSRNSGIFYMRSDNDSDNGRMFIFEGSNPFIGMMSPGSPFSRLFGQILNPRYGTPASSATSNNPDSRRPETSEARNTASNQQQRNPGIGGSASLGGDHLMNFINQLMSNLAENGESNPTRLTFHIDGGNGGAFQQIHGNLNDYAWGEGGIDHIVTQLLNQFESGNTENISAEDIARLPMTEVNEKQVENGTQCATCMETFTLKEPVAQLDCQHIFHRPCIDPWLKKHNTCPICRKVLDPKTWGPKITDVDELD